MYMYMHTYENHSHLCGLSTACLSHQHHTAVLLHCLHEVGVVLPNRQGLPLLQDLPEPCGKGSPCVLVHLQLWYGCVLGLGGGAGGRGRGRASASVIISSTLGGFS